jgi:hypothetical protein
VIRTLGNSDGTFRQASEEARRLSGADGVWRHGPVLTVDTREGVQYRFVDAGVCEGYYTCRRWTFQGSAQTMGHAPQARLLNYWLIAFDQGEGGYWLAINADDGSSTLLDTKPAISLDKRLWATGDCNELSDDSLKIFETDQFGRLTLAVEAGDTPCCEMVGWEGATLKVKSCDLDPHKVFEDRLSRQTDGSWAGERLRLARPKTP